MMYHFFLSLLYLPLLSIAAPSATSWGERWLSPRGQSDAPFSVDEYLLQSSVTCPNGIQGKPGGTVLLVHGTGVNGSISWDDTPYIKSLPTEGLGFDVCRIDLPNLSLTDAQIGAEYVAYNIPVLAQKSATGKVSVIGHSQGAGCQPQWALTFWPSIRQYVHAYVGLGGDYHGTTGSTFLVCAVERLAAGGCEPSLLQQNVGANYMNAQNKLGLKALVPMTSIYTLTEDAVAPENKDNTATSYMEGASNIYLQRDDMCGPLHFAEHFMLLVDGGAFALAVDALTHDGQADTSRLDTAKACTNLTGYSNVPAFIKGIATATINTLGFTASIHRVEKEPPLKSYVCEAASGRLNNPGPARLSYTP